MKSTHITFVTTNNGKFEEVSRWLAQLAPFLQIEQAAIDIPEYQSLNVQEIAHSKAQHAYNLLNKPVLIDDGGLYLDKYNNFPGPLSKYVYQGIGFEGTWLLAQADPRAYFLTCLVYMYNQNSCKLFEATCQGRLIEPRNYNGHKNLPYSSIFMPIGSSKTLAELRGTQEEENYHHRFKALKEFITWLHEQD